MKLRRTLFLVAIVLALTAPPLSEAQDLTTKRRPDKAEFVTETQVRLTTESLKIAEIAVATPGSKSQLTFRDFLLQSWQEFVATLKTLFN